jgi:hypothetical protein
VNLRDIAAKEVSASKRSTASKFRKAETLNPPKALTIFSFDKSFGLAYIGLNQGIILRMLPAVQVLCGFSPPAPLTLVLDLT